VLSITKVLMITNVAEHNRMYVIYAI
jgi:hypothetical protein